MAFLDGANFYSSNHRTGVSLGIVKEIISRGISDKNVSLVSNGYDLDICSKASAPWRPAGIKNSDLTAIFTGMHALANGPSALLYGAEMLVQKEQIDLKPVLVGHGAQKAVLQPSATPHSLSDVVFHDSLKKEYLAVSMSSADLCMPVLAKIEAFYYGIFSSKFFDCMAVGLLVSDYLDWLAKLVDEYQCGFVVP